MTLRLDDDRFIRHKLYDGQTSAWKRYAQLVIGEPSVWQLLQYEVLTTLLGPLPGALGLALRKLFYPMLFAEVGRGVVFGRNLVIRNGKRITIGSDVMLDDQVLLDGRGGEPVGIAIGDRTVINREALLIAKVGAIRVGANTDIGFRCTLVSTGGIEIGEGVALAGECKIGGGTAQQAADGAALERHSKGPVVLGDQARFYMGVTVLDGVTVGPRAVVGAGIILQDDLAADTTLASQQRLLRLRQQTEAPAPPTPPHAGSDPPAAIAAADGEAVRRQVLLALVGPLQARGFDAAGLGDDFDLLGSGIVDSLGFVELIGTVEQALGIEIELDDLDPEEHTKLGPFCRFVASQVPSSLTRE